MRKRRTTCRQTRHRDKWILTGRKSSRTTQLITLRSVSIAFSSMKTSSKQVRHLQRRREKLQMCHQLICLLSYLSLSSKNHRMPQLYRLRSELNQFMGIEQFRLHHWLSKSLSSNRKVRQMVCAAICHLKTLGIKQNFPSR